MHYDAFCVIFKWNTINSSIRNSLKKAFYFIKAFYRIANLCSFYAFCYAMVAIVILQTVFYMLMCSKSIQTYTWDFYVCLHLFSFHWVRQSFEELNLKVYGKKHGVSEFVDKFRCSTCNCVYADCEPIVC